MKDGRLLALRGLPRRLETIQLRPPAKPEVVRDVRCQMSVTDRYGRRDDISNTAPRSLRTSNGEEREPATVRAASVRSSGPNDFLIIGAVYNQIRITALDSITARQISPVSTRPATKINQSTPEHPATPAATLFTDRFSAPGGMFRRRPTWRCGGLRRVRGWRREGWGRGQRAVRRGRRVLGP
jgi:hypothetical protein